MRFQAPVSALLALLLGFSCYPLSHVAYADEMGFFGGRIGEDSSADAQAQSEAIGEDREAVAGEAHQGEGPEGYFQEEEIDDRGYESGSGLRPGGGQPLGGSSLHPSVAGIGYLPSDNAGNNGDSVNSSEVGFLDSSQEDISLYVAPIVSELGKHVLAALGGAAIDSLANSITSSLGGSKPSRTETLLAAILGWQDILSQDIGANNIRLLNLYNLINQMYTNDIKGLYSVLTHIGVNTDLFKTHLSNIADRVSWTGTLGAHGYATWNQASILGWTYNLLKERTEWTGTLTGHGSDTWYTRTILAYMHNLLALIPSRLIWSGDLGSGTANFTIAELLGNLNLLGQRHNSSLSSIAGRLLYSGDIGYGSGTYTIAELLANSIRFNRASQLRTGVLSGVSSSSLTYTTADLLWHTYNLLYRELPKLSSPTVSVAFDDSGIVSWLSRILTALSDKGVIFISLNTGFSQILDALDKGNIAIIEAIRASGGGGGGGDLLDKLLSAVDAISGFINPGEVVNGVADVLGNLAEVPELAESLIGDLQFDSLDALSSNIGTVVQNKFPFSIPFVFSGFLLMFQVPAVPPVFEFDFWGAPLVLDFSDYGALAELTRFFSVAFFLVGLLSVTRRFIFFGGGSGAD